MLKVTNKSPQTAHALGADSQPEIHPAGEHLWCYNLFHGLWWCLQSISRFKSVGRSGETNNQNVAVFEVMARVLLRFRCSNVTV